MILITGGMGFIGLHTARNLVDAGESVVLSQFRATRTPDFIATEIGQRVHVERLDISDAQALQAVLQRHRVDGIIHLAVPGLGKLSPEDEYRTNTQGLINVLEAAAVAGVRRVTLASSIAVYSGVPAGPFQEAMPLRTEAANATEAYKKGFEVMGLFYASQRGIDVRCARISGIFGPLYHSMANLPSRLCHAAVQGLQPDLSGARGGTPYMDDETDLCYVKDCARGLQLLQMADSLRHRIYNVGAGSGTTNARLAAAVEVAVPGASHGLEPGRGPLWRSQAYLDITRLREDTGFEPAFTVESAVADYVAWLRTHPE